MTTQPDAKRREHITLKAVTTMTDQGVFEAVISTEGIDREKDIVSANGMVAALSKWNRPIPLAWNHRTDAADIFGHLDPASVKNVNGEVVATGQVDFDSDVGKEAWRSFKSRSIGFSFGYLILAATERKGGGRNINELDVFEITATPTPMNNETRVLSTKSTEVLRKESERIERDLAESQIPELPPAPATPAAEEPDLLKELQEVKARLATAETALETLSKKAEEVDKDRKAPSMDPLRKRSEELALEVASDGMSLRRPPTKEAPAPPDLTDLRELKQQSRDLMDLLLSDTTE